MKTFCKLTMTGTLLVAACGPTRGTGSTGSSGSGSTGTGSTSSGLATSTSGVAFRGEVSMVHAVGTPGQFFVAARFSPTSDGGDAPCADGQQVGDCCFQGPFGGEDLTFLPEDSAGTLTVEDGTTSLATLTFSDAGYPSISSFSSPLSRNAGDSFSVSAPGGTVGAFNGSVTAPGTLSGVSPILSISAPPTVQISSDLAVSWATDSTPGELVGVALFHGTKGSIFCSTTDSSGQVIVASSLLAHFAAGDGLGFEIARTGVTTPSCANASVELNASTMSSGALMLQ